jgi:hypothetical protein
VQTSTLESAASRSRSFELHGSISRNPPDCTRAECRRYDSAITARLWTISPNWRR